MNAVLLLMYTLVCISTINILQANGQSTCCDTDNCCDDGCNPPAPFNVSLSEFIASSPLYVKFFPAINLFAGVDSVCLTYVPLTDGSYFATDSTVFSNGFTTKESSIVSQDDVGVFSYGSNKCVTQATVFDYIEKDNCTLYLTYLCFIYGDCFAASGNNIPVFGLSSSNTQISQDCLDVAIDHINRAGVPGQNYFKAPFKQSCACVTNAIC